MGPSIGGQDLIHILNVSAFQITYLHSVFSPCQCPLLAGKCR